MLSGNALSLMIIAVGITSVACLVWSFCLEVTRRVHRVPLKQLALHHASALMPFTVVISLSSAVWISVVSEMGSPILGVIGLITEAYLGYRFYSYWLNNPKVRAGIYQIGYYLALAAISLLVAFSAGQVFARSHYADGINWVSVLTTAVILLSQAAILGYTSYWYFAKNYLPMMELWRVAATKTEAETTRAEEEARKHERRLQATESSRISEEDKREATEAAATQAEADWERNRLTAIEIQTATILTTQVLSQSDSSKTIITSWITQLAKRLSPKHLDSDETAVNELGRLWDQTAFNFKLVEIDFMDLVARVQQGFDRRFRTAHDAGVCLQRLYSIAFRVANRPEAAGYSIEELAAAIVTAYNQSYFSAESLGNAQVGNGIGEVSHVT